MYSIKFCTFPNLIAEKRCCSFAPLPFSLLYLLRRVAERSLVSPLILCAVASIPLFLLDSCCRLSSVVFGTSRDTRAIRFETRSRGASEDSRRSARINGTGLRQIFTRVSHLARHHRQYKISEASSHLDEEKEDFHPLLGDRFHPRPIP